jgi:hypothetical protein
MLLLIGSGPRGGKGGSENPDKRAPRESGLGEPRYSDLSVTLGSTLVARQAGRMHARPAVARSITATATKTDGSFGEMRNSRVQ